MLLKGRCKITAIIYDGKTIAADRRMTRDDRISGEMKKIHKWSDGYWAAAGRLDDACEFADWLEDRTYKFKPHTGFQAVYSESGRVYEILRSLIPMPALAPLGIGSAGTDCELLVRLGYTGKEAIEAVKKVHPTVGGKIDVVTI
jgi:hypothetical protein